MIQTRQKFDSSRFESTLESNTHMTEDNKALIAGCVKEMHDFVMSRAYLYDNGVIPHEAKQMIEHIDRINKQIEKVVKALRKFAMKRGWSILTQMGNAVNEDSANADAMDEDDTDANDIDQ
eukprot:910313_1